MADDTTKVSQLTKMEETRRCHSRDMVVHGEPVHQSWIWPTHRPRFLQHRSTSVNRISVSSWVSSACIWCLIEKVSITSFTISLYAMNSNGPTTELCGTQQACMQTEVCPIIDNQHEWYCQFVRDLNFSGLQISLWHPAFSYSGHQCEQNEAIRTFLSFTSPRIICFPTFFRYLDRYFTLSTS